MAFGGVRVFCVYSFVLRFRSLRHTTPRRKTQRTTGGMTILTRTPLIGFEFCILMSTILACPLKRFEKIITQMWALEWALQLPDGWTDSSTSYGLFAELNNFLLLNGKSPDRTRPSPGWNWLQDTLWDICGIHWIKAPVPNPCIQSRLRDNKKTIINHRISKWKHE